MQHGVRKSLEDVDEALADIKALNGWRDLIPEYVKDYVSLNQFAA